MAPTASLRRQLASAHPEDLQGALDDPAFRDEDVVLVLRSRGATSDILSRIGGTPGWMRARGAKHALVSHPKTPASLSHRFLPHLHGRELADVSANVLLTPSLRRDADRLLRLRLPEMTPGERTALARVAGRAVIAVLANDVESAPLQALAGNPRTTEADLARILSRTDVPPTFLRWLAERSAWSDRREVRHAVLRHPATPRATALRICGTLPPADLVAIAEDEGVPRLVRVAAARRVDVDTPSGASLQSPADQRHPGLRGLSTSR